MIGRIFTFILGAAATLYMSVLYKSNGLLFVFFAELMMGSVLFIINMLVFFNVKVGIRSEPFINENGEIRFELVIRNKCILPSGKIQFTVNCLDPYKMKYKKVVIEQWCSGRKIEEHSYSFKDDTGGILSGKYIVSIKKISIYDYLGFFKITKKLKKDVTCTVPVVEEDMESAGSMCDESENIVSVKSIDMGEFSHVREYRDGDKLRNIHWKLSSKSDETYVKEFSDGYDNYLCYYIETKPLNRKEISEEFKRWSVAGKQAVEAGDNIVFVWYDLEQGYVRKAYVSNEEELYQALCEINVYDCRKFASSGVFDKNFIVDIDMLMEMEKKG